MKELSLYIHIPFCIKKCSYCDFLSFAADTDTIEAYVNALLLEIESYRDSEISDHNVVSIYIGGGTPSILSEWQIQRLFEKIKSVFNIDGKCDSCRFNKEISLEINPGTITQSKSKVYRELGINRVSIGLQSVHDSELKKLGRIHDYKQFLQSYEMLRNEGIKNINIDLMSALPGQTVDSYCEGLKRVLNLKPEHISAYSLMLEEGTPFYDMYNNRSDLLPDEDSERLMYYRTKELLDLFNYKRYEISNYALPGYECSHNKVYWQRGEYLGLGLGSASFINHTRFHNTEKLQEYLLLCKGDLSSTDGKISHVLYRDVQKLSQIEEMEEFMFLGLRMMRGVSFREFETQFGKSLYEVYGEIIDKYEKAGFLRIYTKKDVFLALTDNGIDVSNSIFEDFLLS